MPQIPLSNLKVETLIQGSQNSHGKAFALGTFLFGLHGSPDADFDAVVPAAVEEAVYYLSPGQQRPKKSESWNAIAPRRRQLSNIQLSGQLVWRFIWKREIKNKKKHNESYKQTTNTSVFRRGHRWFNRFDI